MADEAHDHTYATSLRWDGSTGVGYESYDRAHTVTAGPAAAPIVLSSDPAFGGDPTLANPEQLLVAAASSCQLLSFLAVAARARLDVVGYLDEATAVMPAEHVPMRITHIDLRPHITLADTERDRLDDAGLAHLTELAHEGCYVANSLRTEVTVNTTYTWAGPRA